LQQQSAFRISVCAIPHKPTKTAKRDVLKLECPLGIERSSGVEKPEFFVDGDHLVISSHAGQMRVLAGTNQRMTENSQSVPASEFDTDRVNNKNRSYIYCTQVVVVSSAEYPHARHAENGKKEQRNGRA
jgi:hypothetical protein